MDTQYLQLQVSKRRRRSRVEGWRQRRKALARSYSRSCGWPGSNPPRDTPQLSGRVDCGQVAQPVRLGRAPSQRGEAGLGCRANSPRQGAPWLSQVEGRPERRYPCGSNAKGLKGPPDLWTPQRPCSKQSCQSCGSHKHRVSFIRRALWPDRNPWPKWRNELANWPLYHPPRLKTATHVRSNYSTTLGGRCTRTSYEIGSKVVPATRPG